jgi:tripartite-type tricarboxylate transporter receptor subunit TctC
MQISRLIASSFMALACLSIGDAGAQTGQQIRMIVPYVPGGGTDTLARLLAPAIGEEFGQQVVVDNRAGAGSTIGTQLVARAAPDGRTIGMIDAAFISNPGLYSKLPYDTLKEFVHVVLVASSPLVLAVHPDVKATSVSELIALAKATPGKLTFGSAGRGGGTHLAGEQLRMAGSVNITHVPYKGAGQQVTDLLGGQTTMGFFVPSVAKGHIESGRFRALAVTGSKRVDLFPNVMSFTELGLPSVDASGMNGIVAPAGTPRDIVMRINGAVVRALQTPDMQKRLRDTGFQSVGGTPEDFSRMLQTAIPKMTEVIRAAGVKLDDQ